MHTSLVFLTLLFLSNGLAETSFGKRIADEKCNKLADAVQRAFDSLDDYIACFISKISDNILGYDITDRQTIETLSCLIVDSADNGVELFNALDNAGYIDQIFEVAYVLIAVQGRFVLRKIREQGIQTDLMKCYQANEFRSDYHGQIDPGDFDKLAQVIEDLQLFSFDPERSRRIAAIIGPVARHSMIMQPAPEPCTCSAITDPEERCRMAEQAAAPFIQAAMADDRVMRNMMSVNGYIQQFTGVNLLANFSADASQIVCDTAKIQGVAGYRALLEDYGLLQVGFELGVGYVCAGLQMDKEIWQTIVNSSENGSDYYYTNEVPLFRALINLADVWLEVGFDSIRLDNLPSVPMSMIQEMCRAHDFA